MFIDLSLLTDANAEAGVVATLIYHPDFIFHSNHLMERQFYNMDNACMFWAIRELVNNKVTEITALNISHIIASNGSVKRELEKYNLPSIQEYIDLCFFSKRDTLEEYKMLVNRVIELAFKRDLARLARQIEKNCFQEKTLGQLSSDVYQSLNNLNAKYVTGGEIVTLGQKVDAIYDKITKKKERGESYGLPSVIKSLDPFFQYEEGELIVVAARMKKGKSVLAMMEAIHKAQSGVPTFVQDSEMSDELWYLRAVSYLSGISVRRIKNELLTKEENAKIADANEHIKSLPLFHNYDPYITKEKFYAICAQKKNEIGLKFVIWDYIKCDDSIISVGERSAYMGGVTNWLKNNIAGDLNLSVLAFAQLNRQNEVGESDGIEKFCSVSARWEEKTQDEMVNDGQECGTHKIIVKLNRLGKNHLGENDYIDMKFLDGRPGITEAVQHKKINSPFD